MKSNIPLISNKKWVSIKSFNGRPKTIWEFGGGKKPQNKMKNGNKMWGKEPSKIVDLPQKDVNNAPF